MSFSANGARAAFAVVLGAPLTMPAAAQELLWHKPEKTGPARAAPVRVHIRQGGDLR